MEELKKCDPCDGTGHINGPICKVCDGAGKVPAVEIAEEETDEEPEAPKKRRRS